MVLIERRRAKNFKLRQQIDLLSEHSKRLQQLSDEVKSQALIAAREGRISELPDPALRASLSKLFDLQKSMISQMEQHTLANHKTVVTDDELIALLGLPARSE